MRTPRMYCKKTGHVDKDCEVLAASVKAIQLETERKIVAMTWQDDYNDEDPDTQTVYTIQSESVLSHDNIKTETALASTVHVSSTSVLCDHCASASIFHHAPLLTNIRSCSPVKFSGVGGGIVVSKEGDFGDFGIVKYDPRASFNILSVDSLPDGAAVMYDHASRRHTVLLNNITYHFDVPLGAKGLPLRDFHVQPPNSVSHVQLNTVSQNEASHTHRQVIEAKRASEFGRLLAYPSMKDASAAISGGVFIDNPITLQSLKTSDTIYGTSVACLKGKTVHTPSEIEKIIEVKQDHSQKLRLYADILFVEGNPILLSSSDPIHLLIATSLSSRTSLSISKALNAHIAVYTQENFTISSILVDSESGLLSLREDYARQGIRVDTAPPGQHVPVIERKIRLVKERCRAIMSVLPCSLCRALLVALVLFVVSRINLLHVMGAKAAPHSWN